MKKYSADMNHESQVLAAHTGIAAGWKQEVFKVGCELCEFECGGIVTPAMTKLYGDNASNRVEDHVWTRFMADAKTMNCPHLDRYNFIKTNSSGIPSLAKLDGD